MLTTKAAPLFCKPTEETDDAVHTEFADSVNGTISFKSLNLRNDLPTIHRWVNMPYTREYWQMNGQYSQLYAIYQCMELNPYSHSFSGYLNGEMICQFDVYSVFADELRDHIIQEDHDCGFHLLMSPNRKAIHGLTMAIVKCFLNYYFNFPMAKRMYAEPDVNNQKSIELLERCGFKKIKTVDMSYKKAHVYCIQSPTPSAP